MEYDNRGNLLLADNHDVGLSVAGNLSLTVMSLIITESSAVSDQSAHDTERLTGAMCFRFLCSVSQDVRDDTRRIL